jgi:hypothetical protein
MSLALYFVPFKIPRTVTRKEWYEIHRWRRVTQKQLNATLLFEQEKLRDPSTPSWVKRDLMNSMIYPPLLLGPYMDKA